MKLLYTDDSATRDRYENDVHALYSPVVILAKLLLVAGGIVAVLVFIIR